LHGGERPGCAGTDQVWRKEWKKGGREGGRGTARLTLGEDGQGATAGVAFLGEFLNFLDEFLFGPFNVLQGSVDGADFPADVAFPLLWGEGLGWREGGRERGRVGW
jgi:hypothetical protein